MNLPYGDINENRLTMSFSSADYSVATVLNSVRERYDMFGEMQVAFLGVCTEIPHGPSPVFRPVSIQAIFEYSGGADPRKVLERVYVQMWEAVALTFPAEGLWASAKADFGKFISAQAELLTARTESSKDS